MLSINTNLSSLIAQESMNTSTNKLNQAIERMTTGAKINHAKDNAANYSISTNMTTKMSAYKVAEDNVAMGMDMVATASDTLSEMQNHAERLRALATQARNGTYGSTSLDAIQTEASALAKEVERLYRTAEYNGVKLFDIVEKKTTDIQGPTVNSNGFIKNIDRIDTSGMKRLSEIENKNVALADGEYAICDLQDLLTLVELTNNGRVSAGDTFIMGADIDLGEYCDEQLANNNGGWTPIGDYSITSKTFIGTFDGNGYTISNVKIDRATSDYQALFGKVWGAIKNLKVENVDIVGQNYVGGIVGDCINNTIENITLTGNIQGVQNVGGVAGAFSRSNLNNSCTEITVNGDNCVGGLVGYGSGASIDSCFASGKVYGIFAQIGGIIGWINPGTISNCYSSTDIYAEDAANVGGIVGQLYYSKVFDSYSTGDIYGKAGVAGLVGNSYSNYSTSSICQIKNCYTTSNVIGRTDAGGLVGHLYGDIENCTMKGTVRCTDNNARIGGIVTSGTPNFSIKDCSFEGDGIFNSSNFGLLMASLGANVSEINISGCQIVSKVENPNATLIGSVTPSVACNINISDCTYNSYYDEIGIPLIKSQNANATINMENVSANLFENNLNLQVGVNSDKNSSLNLSTSFFINDFDKLKNVTFGDDYFTTIDNFINLITEKQVQFGAMQNRLDSALDEISIQYENLVSSRSTLRDADMAKESATYIQQQILQEAAATLMSTANQSPSIALQLI